MTNLTNTNVNFDQFETVLSSVQENMTDWWASMLIGRVWNSAQMSVGSAGDKKALLNIERNNIVQLQEDETAKGVKQISHPKAIERFTARVAEKFSKRLTKIEEDTNFYDNKIENSQNVMAVLNDLNSKLVDYFLTQDDYSAISTAEYLMGDTLTNEDDIRVATIRVKHPTISTAKAFDMYYSQTDEEIDKCEELVVKTLQNAKSRNKHILSAIAEARIYVNQNEGHAHSIDDVFMTKQVRSIEASVAKRLEKINTLIEKAQFDLLSLGLSPEAINLARLTFNESGSYKNTAERDLFQLEEELTGLYVVTADINTIIKDLAQTEQSNTMLEPLQQEENREDELKQIQA